MTIVTTAASTGPIAGTGAQTIFNYDFIIPNSGSITAYTTTAGGVETALVYGVDYSATGLDDEDGGTVTYPLSGSPLISGSFITIERSVPYTQTREISNQGAFYPAVVEAALDTATMQIQQLYEMIQEIQDQLEE